MIEGSVRKIWFSLRLTVTANSPDDQKNHLQAFIIIILPTPRDSEP